MSLFRSRRSAILLTLASLAMTITFIPTRAADAGEPSIPPPAARAEGTRTGGQVEVTMGRGDRARGSRPASPSPSRPRYRDCSDHNIFLRPLGDGLSDLMGSPVPTETNSGLANRRCTRIADDQPAEWMIGLDFGTSGTDEATGASVAAAAYATLHLDLPQVATSPPRDALQVVAIPVWYWIENFTPASATASIDDITATVWATPTTTRIATGEDNIVVTCTGPGTPYDTNSDPKSQSSECTHAYDHHGTYTVNVTVTWQLHWESTTGEAGSLPPVNRTTTYDTTITELQAVTH